MLKGNDTELSDAENILFGPKYEELVGKSLSSKNRSKELFGSIKTQGLSKEESRRQPFQKSPIFRSRRYERRGTFTAAGQTLQQQYPTGEQGRGKNEFIDLSASEFCKIHPLVASLLPVKIKQLPKAGRVKHFVRNWQRLTNDLMILDIVRGYEISFILPQRQSWLPNVCQLTKEA